MNDLMTLDAYNDAIKILTECHPEDLVNILSRVLHDRDDVSSPKDREFRQGSFVVPGCPGERDCPDAGHTPDHLAVDDRTVVVQIDVKPL